MARVSIKFVVSFSSQDDNHKVSNIIDGNGFKCWLSQPQEKSGQIEAVFQLEKECLIANIDVGSVWCANMELQVGKSDWAQGVEYKTLLPTVCLTSPIECKNGEGTLKNRTFSSEHFCTEVSKEKWDRIKVICRQPFRKDVQYGLTFIRIKSADALPAENTNLLQSPTSDNRINGKSSEDNSIVKSIQKHFFGRTFLSNKERVDPLQSKLLKIAGTSENGVEQEDALPRTAKLVLAATENIGKFSPQSRSKTNSSVKGQLFSERLEQKYGPKFEDEVTEFLGTLHIDDFDLDHITIADLRHRFEKTQKRKLCGDEKKIFMELCQNYICDVFDKVDNKALQLPLTSKPESENEYPFNTPSRKRKANDDTNRSSPKTPKIAVSGVRKPQGETDTTNAKTTQLKKFNNFSSKSPVSSRNTSSTIDDKETSSVEPYIGKTKSNCNATPSKSKVMTPLNFLSPTNHKHSSAADALHKNKDANSNYVHHVTSTRTSPSMATSASNKKNTDHSHVASLVAAIKNNFPKSSPPARKPSTKGDATTRSATPKQCATKSFSYRGLQLEIGPVNTRTKAPPIEQLVSDIHNSLSGSSDQWLSKEKGLGLDTGDHIKSLVSKAQRGRGKARGTSTARTRGGKRGRGGPSVRSRGGSSGKTGGSSGRKRKQKDEDWSGADDDLCFPEAAIDNPVFHNYIVCSSCKGNVPEHVYSHHYLTCGPSDLLTSSPSRGSVSSSGASSSSTTHSSRISKDDKYWTIFSSSDSDSDLDVSVKQNDKCVSCPICNQMFSEDMITTHANFCCETIGFH
ncbi:uncharacterized protein LOC121367805 [Gigantopelta aegis]|uniref:uncharacterized protein LOC121367805 n=1 Tax=Gigantopelta aegis TaxID=1735272 RepID=UPI001B887A9B|nr:uncharacterized protein LOC121367805 [Gigantopelta aegis]